MAEAPDDEITGELMAMQAELAQAMMENQTRCAGLLEDVQRKLPAERERSAKIKADLLQVQIAGAGFWPFVDLISYAFIPIAYIPLFVNCASFVWTIFLSLKSRGAKK